LGRQSRNAFSGDEVCFLSLIADYAGLAIDDRLNFARSETARNQLESERTKLKLILDLNNSLVSNLKLRDVLQSISPSIRDVMRLDGVALILPDAEKNHLQTHALDFPLSKGLVRQDMSSPLYGSLPARSFDPESYGSAISANCKNRVLITGSLPKRELRLCACSHYFGAIAFLGCSA
jgi:formate hydrogenlyase transcriptional activator